MRAVYIEQYGGPDVVRYVDIAPPVPGPDDVLVAVEFAGVNFMDIHTRQGKYANSHTYPVRLPTTLGVEGAGRVVDVGSAVADISVGDRVAWCLNWGSYAEYAAVPARLTAPVPPQVNLVDAAGLVFPGSTAHYLVRDVARLGPGATCLVHAAAGSVGQLIAQLAKAAGAQVFATVSSPEKAQRVTALGVDEVIRYDQVDFTDEIKRLTDGMGVDVVFDAVGRTTFAGSLRCLRRRGLMVSYGSVTGAIGGVDPIELGEAGSLFLTRPRLADYMSTKTEVRTRAADLFEGLGDGSLKFEIAHTYAFEDVARAHASLEHRKHVGKSALAVGAPGALPAVPPWGHGRPDAEAGEDLPAGTAQVDRVRAAVKPDAVHCVERRVS